VVVGEDCYIEDVIELKIIHRVITIGMLLDLGNA